MKKYSVESCAPRLNLSSTRQRFFTQIIANPYLHQNILLLVTNVLAGIFAYLLHPFLGRMMSLQEYGQVATFISLSLVLATPTQVISTVAAKYASSLLTEQSSAQLNDFIRRLTVILLVAGVIGTCMYMAISSEIASFFHFDSQQEVILFGVIFIVSFVVPLNQGVIQGLQSFGWYALVTLISSFLRLIFAIGFVFLGFGVDGAILGIVLSTLITYLISFIPLRGVLRGPRRHVGSLRALWSYSIFTAIAATGIVVLYSIDTVLAKHFLSASDAGLYAALATIGRTALFVTSGIAIIMFPKVVTLYERGEAHTHLVIQALLGVVALAAVVEIAFCLVPALITKVMFGQTFLPIAGQLPLYGLAMLLLAFAQVIAMYFLAVGNRIFVLVIGIACVLQIALISWHHTTIAQIVNGVLIANTALVIALLIVWMLVYRRSRLYTRAEKI
jgi:O-antigen/teichoic acid export membrane protein